MKGIAIAVGAVFIAGLLGFQVYNSYYTLGNTNEQNIVSYSQKSESILSNFATSIAELSKVNENYKNDLIEVVKANLTGRYGDNGSEAVMQFFKENNLQLDSKLYLNIQNALIAGRKEFQNSQEMIIDVCKNYKTELNGLISGKMLRMAGYPKIDLDHHCTIISDEKTQETFKTKQQKPVL